LDRRGTARLAGFTTAGAVGGRIQLAGGWEVVRGRDRFVLRRVTGPAESIEQPLTGVLRWGRWSFFPGRARSGEAPGDAWAATVPPASRVTVRPWAAGDRMRGADGRPRRVKRFLRDAGIAGVDRAGWPVVVADGEIVWIPGVRRSDAATERSGRPGLTFYCEFDDWRLAARRE
ncbi:MAG TPA: tRNA lysidine(34) synthetase TilS, partial [Gemmatimonadaceae bacterium]|nr:tRNA lysidine(34) synthetase TilS [Gemmatimonadaceae bacterium]